MHKVELQNEQDMLDRIKRVVDAACARIQSGGLTREEASALAESVRAHVERIVPDQMATYDLIYGARFRRLIEQFIPQA